MGPKVPKRVHRVIRVLFLPRPAHLPPSFGALSTMRTSHTGSHRLYRTFHGHALGFVRYFLVVSDLGLELVRFKSLVEDLGYLL